MPKQRAKSKEQRGEQTGFTLVEIIISLAIFSIVAVVALGALVKVIDANKKAQTLQAAITNLNFSLESMSRELRVGSTYYCETVKDFTGHYSIFTLNGQTFQTLAPNACDLSDGATFIAFVSSRTSKTSPPPGKTYCNLVFGYYYGPDPNDPNADPEKPSLYKAEQKICPESSFNNNANNTSFTPLVSPEITITGFNLSVSYDQATKPYPLAYVRVSGYAGEREKERTYFDVETSVSARLP